ncbi:MAG: ABC transporter permease subunit [Oscillospiraceae bacterium]
MLNSAALMQKEEKRKKNSKTGKSSISLKTYLKYNGSLYLMVLPGIITLIMFSYVPMYGVLMAFQKYSPAKGILGSKWVGFDHFVTFFESPYFTRLFGNTLILGILGLIIAFPTSIILALLLNEMKHQKFKQITQTISYMPYFISVVIVVGLMKDMLSTNGGVINDMIAFLGMEKINFFSDPKWFRPMYILSGIWSGVGYGSIIYLAAIAGINPELYESARLDGANRLQQILHITIPCISSTIVIQLIFAVGGIIGNDYQKILLMQSPLTFSTSDVIPTFVYREGILGGSYSYTTAINLFTSIISIILLTFTNWVAKKAGEEALY